LGTVSVNLNLFLAVYPSRFNNNISSIFKSISADGQTCHIARGCCCRFLARVKIVH